MNKYLLEVKKTGGRAVIAYKDDVLVYLEMKDGLTKDQSLWIYKSIPYYESELRGFKGFVEKRGLSVSEILPDLSFTHFWTVYDYKKGTKSRVERMWKDMDDTEKSKALAYIKKYNYYLSENTGVTKLYPQTYLNRKEWNN